MIHRIWAWFFCKKRTCKFVMSFTSQQTIWLLFYYWHTPTSMRARVTSRTSFMFIALKSWATNMSSSLIWGCPSYSSVFGILSVSQLFSPQALGLALSLAHQACRAFTLVPSCSYLFLLSLAQIFSSGLFCSSWL